MTMSASTRPFSTPSLRRWEMIRKKDIKNHWCNASYVKRVRGIHHERFDYRTRYGEGVPRRFSCWKDMWRGRSQCKTSILSSSSVLERGGPVVTKRDPSVKIIGTSTALFRRSEYNDIDQSRSTTSIERFHGVRIIRKIIIFP